MTSTLPEALVVESASSGLPSCSRRCNSGTDDAALKQMISPEGRKRLKVVRPKVVIELRGKLAAESIGRSIGVTADEQQVEQMELVKRQYEQQEADSGAAFNGEGAREGHLRGRAEAVLDKVRDQAKITYVDALSPEETARKMGIDVDNLPPEVQLGWPMFPALV